MHYTKDRGIGLCHTVTNFTGVVLIALLAFLAHFKNCLTTMVYRKEWFSSLSVIAKCWC